MKVRERVSENEEEEQNRKGPFTPLFPSPLTIVPLCLFADPSLTHHLLSCLTLARVARFTSPKAKESAAPFSVQRITSSPLLSAVLVSVPRRSAEARAQRPLQCVCACVCACV